MDSTPHLATRETPIKGKQKSKKDDIKGSPVISKSSNKTLYPTSGRKTGTDPADQDPGEELNK